MVEQRGDGGHGAGHEAHVEAEGRDVAILRLFHEGGVGGRAAGRGHPVELRLVEVHHAEADGAVGRGARAPHGPELEHRVVGVDHRLAEGDGRGANHDPGLDAGDGLVALLQEGGECLAALGAEGRVGGGRGPAHAHLGQSLRVVAVVRVGHADTVENHAVHVVVRHEVEQDVPGIVAHVGSAEVGPQALGARVVVQHGARAAAVVEPHHAARRERGGIGAVGRYQEQAERGVDLQAQFAAAVDGVLQRIVVGRHRLGADPHAERLRVRVGAVGAVGDVVRVGAEARQDVDAVEVVVLRLHQQLVQLVQVGVAVADGEPQVAFLAEVARADALDVVDVHRVGRPGRPGGRAVAVAAAVVAIVDGCVVAVAGGIGAEVDGQRLGEGAARRHPDGGADGLVAERRVAGSGEVHHVAGVLVADLRRGRPALADGHAEGADAARIVHLHVGGDQVVPRPRKRVGKRDDDAVVRSVRVGDAEPFRPRLGDVGHDAVACAGGRRIGGRNGRGPAGRPRLEIRKDGVERICGDQRNGAKVQECGLHRDACPREHVSLRQEWQ